MGFYCLRRYRLSCLLIVPSVKEASMSATKCRVFLVVVPLLWNSLPLEDRQALLLKMEMFQWVGDFKICWFVLMVLDFYWNFKFILYSVASCLGAACW